MKSQGASQTDAAPMSRAGLLRLMGLLVSIALVIGLGSLLVARILTANQVVKQAPKRTTQTMVGSSAPNLTLTVWSGGTVGKSLALASLYGHPVVMNVWEATCIPCQMEAPLLETAYSQYGPKGVVFVGVALETSQADGLAFLHEHHLTYLAGLAPTYQTLTDYHLIGIPDTYFIDSQGKVVYAVVGALDQAKLDAGLKALTR